MLSSCQSVAMLWPFSAPTQEHNRQYELKGDVQLLPKQAPNPPSNISHVFIYGYQYNKRERERERGILQNKATKYFTRIS